MDYGTETTKINSVGQRKNAQFRNCKALNDPISQRIPNTNCLFFLNSLELLFNYDSAFSLRHHRTIRSS